MSKGTSQYKFNGHNRVKGFILTPNSFNNKCFSSKDFFLWYSLWIKEKIVHTFACLRHLNIKRRIKNFHRGLQDRLKSHITSPKKLAFNYIKKLLSLPTPLQKGKKLFQDIFQINLSALSLPKIFFLLPILGKIDFQKLLWPQFLITWHLPCCNSLKCA